MRCYFIRGGHIAAVAILTDASDDDAVKEAEALYEQRKHEGDFSGFEVWDRDRFVHRYPGPTPKFTNLERSTADGSQEMTSKDLDLDLITREVRRLRAEARALPVAEIRKNLEDAADRLEKVVAQHLERESVTTDKKAS